MKKHETGKKSFDDDSLETTDETSSAGKVNGTPQPKMQDFDLLEE